MEASAFVRIRRDGLQQRPAWWFREIGRERIDVKRASTDLPIMRPMAADHPSTCLLRPARHFACINLWLSMRQSPSGHGTVEFSVSTILLLCHSESGDRLVVPHLGGCGRCQSWTYSWCNDPPRPPVLLLVRTLISALLARSTSVISQLVFFTFTTSSSNFASPPNHRPTPVLL